MLQNIDSNHLYFGMCRDCSYYRTTTGVVGEGMVLNLGRDLGGVINPVVIDFGTRNWTVCCLYNYWVFSYLYSILMCSKL